MAISYMHIFSALVDKDSMLILGGLFMGRSVCAQCLQDWRPGAAEQTAQQNFLDAPFPTTLHRYFLAFPTRQSSSLRLMRGHSKLLFRRS
jgi:hypothetical protein